MPEPPKPDATPGNEPPPRGGENKEGGKREFTLEDVVRGLQYIAQQVKYVNTRVDSLEEAGIAQPSKENAQPPAQSDAPPKQDDSPKQLSDRDLETMSQAELHRYTVESVINSVKTDLLGPLVKRFASTEDNFERRLISKDLDEIEEREPLFTHLRGEVKQILEKHPDLTLDEAYGLARHAAKDKVEQYEKAQQEAEAKEASEQQKARDAEYGGLLPTSGNLEGVDNMDMDKAAEIAWEKSISGTPFEQLLAGS